MAAGCKWRIEPSLSAAHADRSEHSKGALNSGGRTLISLVGHKTSDGSSLVPFAVRDDNQRVI